MQKTMEPGTGRAPIFDSALMYSVVGEHLFHHPGHADEQGDVGLGDGASQRAEALANLDVVPVQAQAHHRGIRPVCILDRLCGVLAHGVS